MVLQYVAVCCSVLQCVAYEWCCDLRCEYSRRFLCTHPTCNTLQHTATHCDNSHTVTHRNTLQHTTTHCDTPQHTATHCNAPQRTSLHSSYVHHWSVGVNESRAHCNTPQHTATHRNTLQHTATLCNRTATHRNALQHTATHCNTQISALITGP